MKIIGTNGSKCAAEEFICTVSRAELQRLCGYYYQRDVDEPRLEVGATVDISKMQSLAAKAAEIRADLAGSVKTLRACADLVDGQADIIKLESGQ